MRITWDNCGKRPGLTTNVEWLWMIMLFLFSAILLVMVGFSLWTLRSDFAFSLSFLVPICSHHYYFRTLLAHFVGWFSNPFPLCLLCPEERAENSHAHVLSFPCSSLEEPPGHILDSEMWGEGPRDLWERFPSWQTERDSCGEPQPFPIHHFLPALDIAMWGSTALVLLQPPCDHKWGHNDALKVANRWKGPVSLMTSLSNWASTGTFVFRPLISRDS